MPSFSNATPAERFRISAIAIERMRKAKARGEFDWAAFAALREQVAQEQAGVRKHSLLQKLLARMCDRLERLIGFIRRKWL